MIIMAREVFPPMLNEIQFTESWLYPLHQSPDNLWGANLSHYTQASLRIKPVLRKESQRPLVSISVVAEL